MDKAFWKSIMEADYALPEGRTAAELTPELMRFLGSTDLEDRDGFGYSILTQWIIRDHRYSDAELRAMRDQWLANLRIGLGEQGTDSVFLRSFSALMLSVIAYWDIQNSFLSEAEVKGLLDEVLVYFAAEKDLRGYVPDKGWAHSTAHTADVFKFLARNTKTDPTDHQRILNAIVAKLLWPVPDVYIHGEDERLVSALLDILKRRLIEPTGWEAWFTTFTTWKEGMPDGDFQATVHAPWYNSKNLLRSFYFRLEQNPDLPPPSADLKPRLLELIKLFGQ